MEERYIATVDLGTSKLALAVAKVTGDNTEILYYKERPSDGVRYGCVLNPTRASVPLIAAVKEVEDELSIRISQLVIGLPRFGVEQETSSAKSIRSDADSCITQEEIDDIKNLAMDSYPLDNADKQEIYGSAAQSFSTDDAINCTEEDVVGMPSSVLEGNFKVFVGSKKAYKNIDTMLNKANIAPACKYFLPEATAGAVLSAEEKENGVALIEMGGGVTSVTIYQGGIMRFYHAIQFGGKSITNDIKLECGFNERLAENIKLGFGACLPDKLQSMTDKILQIRDEENGTTQQLPVKYLSEIIDSRVREIVDAILFKIQESGYANRLRNGVVLTGGCANLTNCGNLIKEMSGYNVRLGFPRLKNFTFSECPGIGEASAVASIGLLMLARENRLLNCTDEFFTFKPKSEATRMVQEAASAKKEEKPQTAAPVEESKAKIELKGTVFEEPAKIVKAPGPRKQSKLEKNIITWTKRITSKPIEWAGKLYDNMDSDESGQSNS